LNREEKAAVIDQVATQIQESEADLRHRLPRISVTQVAELRGKLAESDASLRVVKNSLTERRRRQAAPST
jgi:large subunit ribosomal protein L10